MPPERHLLSKEVRSGESELPQIKVLKSEAVEHFSNTLLQGEGALVGAVASADPRRAPVHVERLCLAQLSKAAWGGTPASPHLQRCVHVLSSTPGAGICTVPHFPREIPSQTPDGCPSACVFHTAYPHSTLSSSQGDPTKQEDVLSKLMNIISEPTSLGRRES